MSKGKVCLAYSGGLDTSCILVWLIEQGYEVIAFMANIGQDEDFAAAKEKALEIGASKVYIEDVRKEFVEEMVVGAIGANATYEGIYLLGTSLARPTICRAQIKVAKLENCTHVSHGCTGKGNDQVRFELGYYALQPNIKVIAPWRLKEFYSRFRGRQDLLAYAAEKGIPVSQTPKEPWSTDENLFHISYEAGILEDPSVTPPAKMWKLTCSPFDAPANGEQITIHFKAGVPTKLVLHDQGDKVIDQGVLEIFLELNKLGCKHGIGRIDIVENRFIGIKSRGCYETPGGTILRSAHMDLEGLTMDREVRKLRDETSLKYAQLLYNGLYFTPETQLIVNLIRQSQTSVSGSVKLHLYKGNVIVLGRKGEEGKKGLYSMELSSMDESISDAGGWEFEPVDSEGFIKILSMRLRMWSGLMEREGVNVGNFLKN
ncbi:arginosuccinate synthetase [Paraphysoderma sedebokerense]|nr:arginosuccinate synthetase [Paraphysoderma sedebokerense]